MQNLMLSSVGHGLHAAASTLAPARPVLHVRHNRKAIRHGHALRVLGCVGGGAAAEQAGHGHAGGGAAHAGPAGSCACKHIHMSERVVQTPKPASYG